MKTTWWTGFWASEQEGEILAYTENFFWGTMAVIKVTKSSNAKYKINSLVSVPIHELYFPSVLKS